MKVKTRVASVLMVLFCVACVQGATVISDTFSRTGDLDGSFPDTGTGSWQVPALSDPPDTDGSVLNMSTSSGSSKRFNLGFDFVSGRIYTLTVDVDVEDGLGTGWMAAGFTTNTELFSNTDSSVLSWMHVRSADNGTSDGVAFGGYGTDNSTHYNITDFTNAVTFKIVLNTSLPNWETKFYVNNELKGTFSWSETPVITGIFLSSSDGVSGTVDNLLLTDNAADNPPSSGPVIIHDTFSRSGGLDGSSPDVSENTWAAPAFTVNPYTDGSVLNMSPDSGSSKRLNVPFDFVAGRVYTLTVDVDVEDGKGAGWMAAGFTTNTVLFSNTDSSVVSWMHIRSDDEGTSSGVAFGGYGTANSTSYDIPDFTNAVTFKIVLNTGSANWETRYYVDDVLQHTFSWAEKPQISGIFLSSSDGVGGTFDNLLLVDNTVLSNVNAEISSMTLLGNGMVKLTVNSDYPEYCFPKYTTNLNDAVWSSIGHSPDGLEPFLVTNMAYSSASDNGRIIYVTASASKNFFKIGAE